MSDLGTGQSGGWWVPGSGGGYPPPPYGPQSKRRRPLWKWTAFTVALLLVASVAALVTRGITQSAAKRETARGIGASRQQALPPLGSGYLATGTGYVMFIQWDDTNGQLSGSVQAVQSSGQPPDETTSSATVPVTGTISGSTLSLSFNQSPLQFGTLSNNSFTINFPESDGTLTGVVFTSSSAASYNHAVAQLNNTVTAANKTAEEQDAIAHVEHQIAKAAATVSSDISSNGFFTSGLVQEESNLANDVEAIPAALQTESNDLATTYAEEQKVATKAQQYPNGDYGAVCADARGVEADARGVEADARGVEADANSVESNISSVRGGISRLNSDFVTFQSDEAKLPGYQPRGAPTQQQVSSAINDANSAIASAISTTNGYIDRANAEVTTAYGYAAKAYQVGKCGTSPNPPSPQPDITG